MDMYTFIISLIDSCIMIRSLMHYVKCYSCLFMQKDDAEQNTIGIGGL